MRRNPKVALLDMLIAARRAHARVSGLSLDEFLESEDAQWLAWSQIVILGEAANRVQHSARSGSGWHAQASRRERAGNLQKIVRRCRADADVAIGEDCQALRSIRGEQEQRVVRARTEPAAAAIDIGAELGGSVRVHESVALAEDGQQIAGRSRPDTDPGAEEPDPADMHIASLRRPGSPFL